MKVVAHESPLSFDGYVMQEEAISESLKSNSFFFSSENARQNGICQLWAMCSALPVLFRDPWESKQAADCGVYSGLCSLFRSLFRFMELVDIIPSWKKITVNV